MSFSSRRVWRTSTDEEEPPQLPGFVWDRLSALPLLADFIGEGSEYNDGFEAPLDDASKILRKEHALILRNEGGWWAAA